MGSSRTEVAARAASLGPSHERSHPAQHNHRRRSGQGRLIAVAVSSAKVLARRRPTRAHFERLWQTRPPCTVVLEARGSATTRSWTPLAPCASTRSAPEPHPAVAGGESSAAAAQQPGRRRAGPRGGAYRLGGMETRAPLRRQLPAPGRVSGSGSRSARGHQGRRCSRLTATAARRCAASMGDQQRGTEPQGDEPMRGCGSFAVHALRRGGSVRESRR
jgi:hypothetical protein